MKQSSFRKYFLLTENWI